MVQVYVPSETSVYYVSVSAKPEILRIRDTTGQGAVSVSGYGQPVTLTPATS